MFQIKLIFPTLIRSFSTSLWLSHNPSLKKKIITQGSKGKKGSKSKSKKSNYGEATYFKPTAHHMPFDTNLMDEIPLEDRCEIATEMDGELRRRLSVAKAQEHIYIDKHIKERLQARDSAMKLLRCNFPHAYLMLIESLPKTRTNRKPKELDIIPGDPPLLNFPLEFNGPCETPPIPEFQHPDEIIDSDFHEMIIKKHLKTDL